MYCFDKNGPPYKNGPGGPFLSNTMDIRHLTKMEPPPINYVLCNKFMFYHCGMKSYNDIHYNRNTTQSVMFHFIE